MTPGAALGAALIAGAFGFLGALLGVLLRDFVAAPRNELAREERQRRRAAFALYGSYADPLAAAATAVFWRLEEAFYHPGRAAYLELSEPVTEFQRYKLESTVYRLAALLGWIRAFRRELSFFSLDDRTRLYDLEREIGGLGKALAEGKREEARRAERLSTLWGVGLPGDGDRVMEASVKMEEAVKTRHGLNDLWRMRERPDDEQLAICATAAETLCRSVGEDGIASEKLREALPRAVDILGVREAWIFRDQQAAIGDLMLRELKGEPVAAGPGARRFEVMGYGAFDAMLREPSEDAPGRRWIGLLRRMLTELNVREDDGSDARVYQLRMTLLATAKILVAVAGVPERPGSVDEETASRAREVIAHLDSATSVATDGATSPKAAKPTIRERIRTWLTGR